MSLVDSKSIVLEAARNGYAIPAINCQGGNYDLIRAIVETAHEERSPIIVACHPNNAKYYGLDWAPIVTSHLAEHYNVPVAIHLDHGTDVALVERAILLGYTSVMIDYSSRPFKENIEATLRVLKAARLRSVSVEAELGALSGSEAYVEEVTSGPPNLIDPTQVGEFLRNAPVDMLAIGIGNAHGFYKREPEIRLDLLTKVKQIAGDTPLVLHGTTGIPEPIVRECIRNGMAKINFGTMIRMNLYHYLQDAVEGAVEHRENIWRILQYAKDQVKEDIRAVIALAGSAGKA